MATAKEIVDNASESIGYKAAETPLEAADAKIALEELNDMLAEWLDSGIDLGAVPVKNLADEVRIPRGAVSAVKKNLAVRLCVPFTRPITPELLSVANASTKSMLRSIVKIDVEYPGTLPRGSGNQYDEDDTRFFSQNSETNF